LIAPIQKLIGSIQKFSGVIRALFSAIARHRAPAVRVIRTPRGAARPADRLASCPTPPPRYGMGAVRCCQPSTFSFQLWVTSWGG
jgi:hypothetical protein